MNIELIKQYCNPSMIIDLGANLGQSSLEFRINFPDAKIIAVEGNPYCTVELHRISSIEVMEGMLFSRWGEVRTFYSDPNNLTSKVNGFYPLMQNMALRDVRCVTLDNLKIHTNNYDLLVNVDLNGAELEVLEGGREVCENAEAIIVTSYVEPPYTGFVSLEEVVKYMGQYGFVGVQDVDYYLDGQKIVRKSVLFLNNLKIQK